jgi:Na+/H+ antiporter NhaD/arsenite permease-like protein
MTFAIVTLFILGYILITLEHKFKLNKSITAAALGAGLWGLIAFHEGHDIEEALHPVAAETFALVVFLLSAMTLVEILVHYRFFDVLRTKLYSLGLGDFGQLWLISGMAFFFSAVLDNLTTTIVMVQIAHRFFKGKNLLIAAASVVLSANAGGAFSPIGDVTTIMIWLEGKFSTFEIIAWGFLPSLALFVVSTFLLARQLTRSTEDVRPTSDEKIALSRSEKTVITATFISFSFPLLAHILGLPPYIGILFGVGMVGLLVGLFVNVRPKRESHLSMDIQGLLAKVDITSLVFFIGILFAVGALGHIGVLSSISHTVFGATPETWRLITGNVLLGAFSAIVDNIPLTAAALDILNTSDPLIWVLLAISVGTGGSMLVIGSAAGVVAMGMVKELTFKNYFKIATLPAALGFSAAIIVWCVEYFFIH